MKSKRIIILSGDEKRHEYFRKKVALNPEIEVLASYCEGLERSLENRTKENPNSSLLEKYHVDARTQAERDFFGESIEMFENLSRSKKIKKGGINDNEVVEEIIALNPDLLVCYGSSLIKSKLLDLYEGKFLNVHLGLSPYYRGSGTNVWPLINREPYMVGATFMYIDAGIDTGKIIHQIRADLFIGDSPSSIGNRLIKRMTETYCKIIIAFKDLVDEQQPSGKGRLYLTKHFDADACKALYQSFKEGMIEDYIEKQESVNLPYIVRNTALRESS